MKLLRHPRVIILFIALILAVAAINPRPWQDGATIRNVEKDSAASIAGMLPSSPKTVPVLRERIVDINGERVHSEADFLRITNGLPPNATVRIDTNKNSYILTTEPLIRVDTLPEKETVTVTESAFNNTTGEFENVTKKITRNKTREVVIGTEPLGITTYDAPKTNIRFGLDISGGARVLLEPEEAVTDEQFTLILDTIKQRLNIYGLSDIVVREVKDLEGNRFVLVEVAGASERDVRDLVLQQGKFEAKIGNETVWSGGTDITYVCRSPQCSGIGQSGCQQIDGGFACEFQFQLTTTPEAAEKHAEVTKNLAVVTSQNGQQYLEKPLDLYLDDELTDTLQIGASLRGSAVTDIAISGSGAGATEQAAVEDALANMKQLQTILITGSLPVKLSIVKTDTISSELGDEFIRNALFAGFLAFAAVTAVVMIRFRRLAIAIPVVVTLISELVLILGVAALIGWNMDLAAIAGILIAIGTGVDDQIVIADETIGARKRKETDVTSWKEKLKRAFFMVFASYFTALAAMIPLWWAGAGLVRGFAITTIIGISMGVLITRPVFAVIVEKLERDD